MTLPLIGTGLLLLPTLVLALLWALARRLLGRPVRTLLGRVLWLHLGLLPLHALVTLPLLFGWVGSRLVDTRPDERGYAGPRILADGKWQIQDAGTLRAEREGEAAVPADLAAAAAARAVSIPSTDGVRLRAFVVEPRAEPPRAMALLVHGLFRGAMELEPVGSMLRDLGCEVCLLELRNHGGSSRAPATFGLREADDVVAAAAWLRARTGRGEVPLLLFGVSLGTAAVARALPRIPRVAGVALDAPLEDLQAAAHRMLGATRNRGRRVVALAQPWRSLTLRALEWWSDFALADVAPLAALTAMPAGVPVLVVGGGADDRAPPQVVTALWRSLPQAEPDKELWIRDGSGHGNVWHDDPAGYRARLRRWLDRAVGAR